MITGNALIREAIAALNAAGVDGAARDARLLLAHALGVAPDRLTLVLPDVVNAAQADAFHAAIAQRAKRQPVAQIIGQRMFYGRNFLVTPDTLDPRPETEVLIAAALAQPFTRVLDIGTGTGCILLTLLAENQQAVGQGVDLSPAALDVAQRNAVALGLDTRAEFSLSDWGMAATGRFDLIVSNPPYIALDEMAGLSPEVTGWEPAMALTDGGDGLAAYRAILADAPRLLSDAGRVIVEFGPTQADAIRAIGDAAGFTSAQLHHDLDGRDRCLVFSQ
ncbi:peptide chain release factor N(5)-glutamine methyltransferase [Ketogulonicigenium vulgare]|uniref:Release factor glutamine methyltransferase n=1 Tax=Ketogulonicigenium vulgare (strain WSH-001) TaxID=759362 RepID=F9Y6X6_KETVW|nr:peptide chain release factor N(5)-glutamine methyltransferase [Ketogulonicigenium vulgare]ADO42808.1 protein-(glutamine-N5) methyltransferase, release factor-specific [Ketogulonicigenium vulgare Y25]AEM40993.1 Protein-(Glutamine-N5) methyltransferase, release factor-specific [Ketogulonicigenium vulgare WSH-001]ALJ81144.1 protein-(glutamine-N5) methyltransferase, release factor-specific [Ketogulonicigenium vulgare]AOZ54720.1 protein-(glutamine-N5) methyltransferase, release factor-specific [K